MRSSSKPSDFSLLFEVFREGLALGLISKDEVVSWADSIIIEEDGPDYFFIEIALSPSTDSLVTLIDSRFTRSSEALPVRVIFGLMYERLKNDRANFEKYLSIIDKYNYNYEDHRPLTEYESTCIYSFDYYEGFFSPMDLRLLKENVLSFLSVYTVFRLDNIDEWEAINNSVNDILKVKAEEMAKAYQVTMALHNARQKRKIINRQLLTALFIVLPLVCLLIVVTNYGPIGGAPPANKLMHDVYQFSVLLLEIFCGYYIMRVFYWVGKGIGSLFGGK